MPTYVFQWDYASSYGQGKKGDKVDLDPLEAESIDRDSPGVLVLEAELALIDQGASPVVRIAPPAQDRQLKPARVRKEK